MTKGPVSSVILDIGAAYARITVFNRGVNAGTLVVLAEDGAEVAKRLLGREKMIPVDDYQQQVNSRADSIVKALNKEWISARILPTRLLLPAVVINDDVMFYVMHDEYELWIKDEWDNIRDEDELIRKIKKYLRIENDYNSYV